MTTYTQKRILIIFTGGTVAGNVAKSKVSQNTKSDPNSFLDILNGSVDIVKKNWHIEITASVSELLSVDSSNIQPEN
jgi:L-asparaginase/Glu-tRNA(Gln) amidotransferase subunit D